MKYLILAAFPLPVVLSGSLALARDYGIANGVIGHSMRGCMQMMQGMNGGGSRLPNEQRRRGQVAPGGEKPGRATRQIIGAMNDR
jgi:hypothetical protein